VHAVQAARGVSKALSRSRLEAEVDVPRSNSPIAAFATWEENFLFENREFGCHEVPGHSLFGHSCVNATGQRGAGL
jgi:hypothetical protein